MANVKITDLTAYTNPVSTDVLPIVDVGADVTKKVSIADLLENAGSGTAAAPGIAFDGDSNTGIYRPGADQVAISTNGTGRLFVDANGKITNSVAGNNPSDLNVVGTISVGDNSYGTAPSLVGSLNFITDSYSDTKFIAWMQRRSSNARAYIGSIGNGNYTADIVFGTNDSTGDSAATERLRITSDGKVGLGTSSPDSTLHVAGTARLAPTISTGEPCGSRYMKS